MDRFYFCFFLFPRQIDNLDLSILHFESFGKNFAKSQRLSPDAFVQIAMQLAFYKMHKKAGSAYESGSLRKFIYGRTEIIRSCSDATVKFVESTSNKSMTNTQCAQLLLNAISHHSKYTRDVLNNESFDRHLLGLKLTALENNLTVPDLYDDVAFKRLCHYHLSSSQVNPLTYNSRFPLNNWMFNCYCFCFVTIS